MFFQFDMSAGLHPPVDSTPPPSEAQELLRQLVELQREQVTSLRYLVAAHDIGGRWRAFVSRWKDEFGELPSACRQIMPVLEKSYGKLVTDLAEQVRDNDSDALDNDFALQEFLDRYGMRLTQLGTLLSLVGPIADAGASNG